MSGNSVVNQGNTLKTNGYLAWRVQNVKNEMHRNRIRRIYNSRARLRPETKH